MDVVTHLQERNHQHAGNQLRLSACEVLLHTEWQPGIVVLPDRVLSKTLVPDKAKSTLVPNT